MLIFLILNNTDLCWSASYLPTGDEILANLKIEDKSFPCNLIHNDLNEKKDNNKKKLNRKNKQSLSSMVGQNNKFLEVLLLSRKKFLFRLNLAKL